MNTPLPQLFSGEHLSEFGLSVAADGEVSHLSDDARAHLAHCPLCEEKVAAAALEMLDIPSEILANVPATKPAEPVEPRGTLRALLAPIAAALAIGGVGLAIRVVTLDRRALREGARALRACAHASPNGQLVPLLSLLVAFAATLLAIAVIRRLPAPTKELS
jgi:hypothetical protein